MRLDFDLDDVTVTEFGVGRDDGNGQTFVAVPADAAVQAALREIAQATWDGMQRDEDGPARYEPSDRHGGTEYLYLPVADDLAASVRQLHQAANLPVDASALTNPADVFCYFARFTDNNQRRLTAMRRATQFKGVLKSRNRLIRMLDDTLQIIEDRVFKLDSDFDLLVDSANVHIWRPSGFEFVGALGQEILEAVPKNIATLETDLPFVDFDEIAKYAAKHPRAARYLASIRGQGGTKNIDRALLKRLCKQTGVEVRTAHGKVTVAAGHEMAFLEVLDRRRYEVALVRDKPERYRAGSRRKIHD
jgi:hypothetical protein